MTTTVKKSVLNTSSILGFTSLYQQGGKGNGTIADETACMVAALATGLPVFVPAGTWNVSPITVPNNAIIFGSGDLSVVKLIDNSDLPVFTAVSGVSISDVKIDGNSSNQTGTAAAGISLVSASNCKVKDVTVVSTAGSGILAGGTGIKLTDCDVSGFTRNGIEIIKGSLVSISNCHAHDSDVVASPGNGISLATTSSGFSCNCN